MSRKNILRRKGRKGYTEFFKGTNVHNRVGQTDISMHPKIYDSLLGRKMTPIVFSNKPNSLLFVIDEDKEPGENGQKTDPNWQVLLAS